MTDPRGITTLKVGKKHYPLRLPINAICDMEENFSQARGVEMDCQMIGLQLESASFRSIRRVVFHGLADGWQKKDGELTEELAGELMQQAGMEEAAKQVGKLWRETFPQPDADAEADQDEDELEEAATGNPAARKANQSKPGNVKPKK